MNHINGINITDANHDRVCLNCIHWQANTQLYGAADGVICMISKNHTEPTDTCSRFYPNHTLDDVQDPNRWQDKTLKMNVYKRF